ncbi:MAG: large conductance mechanosensitive channel protein MscL [Anaerolineaceae bacterium]|nr:large conductance mechanosensitive channel protein MscL [Anaerolineaceae bacterium]
MLKEFKDFIMRGNVLDMAIGIVIGTAFGGIIKSLVDDLIMPPIGLLLGKVDFGNLFILIQEGSPSSPYSSLADAKDAGAVTINYGVFFNVVLGFIIIALIVFFIIRMINRLRQEQEAPPAETSEKDCPFCFSKISIQATRCPSCTSQL